MALRTDPHGSCTCRVVRDEGLSEFQFDAGRLQELLDGERFFWLDLRRPSLDELHSLGETFGFHPLALEDTHKFGQRPKLEDYDDFAFLVVYGYAPDEDGLVEVHCFYSERYLVTVRRDEAPAFTDLHREYVAGRTTTEDPILLLHRVIDALVDSFFPVLEQFDGRLDVIEEEIFRGQQDVLLQEILVMKRRLATLRKVIAPQRDLFGRMIGGVDELRGMTQEAGRYFRDIYDHLIRLTDMIETHRDLTTSLVDVYMSTASNRMNAVMKQLAVIATIFLPLTFIGGFFGQNFGWLVEHVDSGWAFVVFGLGTQMLAIILLLGLFKRRGWF